MSSHQAAVEPPKPFEESQYIEAIDDAKQVLQEGISDDEMLLEKRVKRKLDGTLITLCAIGFFLASMGRSDLGNARIAGLTEDLHLSNQQYSNVASVFYAGYLAFQLPSTLLIRKITPPVQFFLCAMLWGLFTTCTVAVKSYGSLITLRILVGAAEALLQGGLYFVSIMYKPRELGLRLAIIDSTSSLAGACNGLIALGVEENLSGVNGWAAWQWLFLIEGVIPMGFAFVDLIFVPASPEKLRFFFNEEEKALILRRSRLAQNTSDIRFRPTLILVLFKDPVFWLCVCVFSGMTFASAAFTNFLPAIIKSFGWSSVTAQAVSVIPYAISALTTIFWAFLSDRIGQRLLIMMTNILIAIIGFILLLTVHSKGALMVGACFVLAGVQPGIAITTAFIPNSLPGPTFLLFHISLIQRPPTRSTDMYRASGIALVNAFAQAFSISAGQAYRNPKSLYREGNIVALSMLAMAFVTCSALRLYVTQVNKAKVVAQNSETANELRRASTVDDVGNRHPDFMFIP